MKKLGRYILIISCFVLMCACFAACSFGGNDNSADDGNTPSQPAKVQTVELAISGIYDDIVVGEEMYSKLKVQKKVNGSWEEVVKADYIVSTNYDKTQYGTFYLKVTMKDGSGEKQVDVVVKPLTVSVPSFSTVYTGVNSAAAEPNISSDEAMPLCPA